MYNNYFKFDTDQTLTLLFICLELKLTTLKFKSFVTVKYDIKKS